MKKLKGRCLSFVFLSVGASLRSQSPTKPAYIQYRAVDETFQSKSWRDNFKTRLVERLKDLDLPALIFQSREDQSLILAGPFTSKQSYSAALAKITSQDHVESEVPYFLTSGASEPSSEGSTAPGGASAVIAPAVRWMQDAVKESGGVIRCVTIEPTGISSDAIGPNHSFEITAGGLALGIDLGTTSQVVLWHEIRSVDLVNDGSIDIWTTIHMRSRNDFQSSWYEVSDRPAHLRFWLAATNSQRNIQFVSALRSVVAVSRAQRTN